MLILATEYVLLKTSFTRKLVCRKSHFSWGRGPSIASLSSAGLERGTRNVNTATVSLLSFHAHNLPTKLTL